MKIHEEGFRIAMQKELQLSREEAENFYSEHRGQPHFDELTSRMSMYYYYYSHSIAGSKPMQ